MTVPILGAGAMFFAVLAVYNVFAIRGSREEANEKVTTWLRGEERRSTWSDSFVDRLDQMKWAERLAPKLERASINLRPTEYAVITVFIGFLFVVLLRVGMEAHLILAITLSLSLTPLGSRLFLRSRRNVYITRVERQLSEVCRLLSSSARAGLSIPQGLQIVVREISDPIRSELATVVHQMKIGRSLEVTFRELAKRIPGRDMQVFVNALLIQTRVGGDLALVLSEMARTMEERKIIRKTIDAYISQSKYVAYILPVASWFIVFIMSKMIKGFNELFTSVFGWVVLIIFVLLQVLGIVLVKKIATIRV